MNSNFIGSFRDPSGFVFFKEGVLYRQINPGYREMYEHLMQSGLYEVLVVKELLIPHIEINTQEQGKEVFYKIIKPEPVPFISYPYEWSFTQLKEAALITLQIQRIATEFGMSLKDASAYNIQFRRGRPILIDTLSFEKYRYGEPWVAYRQFCQHFVAPLALMSLKDVRLGQLLRIHIDGIPLDLAGQLLPCRSLLTPSLLLHIHLHAKSQKLFAKRSIRMKKAIVSLRAHLGIINSLESAIRRLRWRARGTAWSNYYDEMNYTPEALKQKREIVDSYIERVKPKSVWDLGANTGLFSRLSSGKQIQTVSFDNDPAAVEKNYYECLRNKETHLLPLLVDLTNPSPSIGWGNRERMSLIDRSPADLVLALALIHHLAISNNLPFGHIAEFLSIICRHLVIEFVPKQDSQVQRLLAMREDIFSSYTQQRFQDELSKYFHIRDCKKIGGSERTIYLMTKRDKES